MSLPHIKIIKIIARELAFNRFLGMISIQNKSRTIENPQEFEKAYNLAEENWFLYAKDAEDLYNIITGKTKISDEDEIKEDQKDCRVPYFDNSIGSLTL